MLVSITQLEGSCNWKKPGEAVTAGKIAVDLVIVSGAADTGSAV
jgi:hypothetical protein